MKPYLVTICVTVLLASSSLAGPVNYPVISGIADELISSIDAAVKQKRDISETVGAAPFLGYHYPVAKVSQYSLSPSSASVHSYSINYPKFSQSRQVFQPSYGASPASLQIPIPVYAERFSSARAIPLSSYNSQNNLLTSPNNLLTSYNSNAFGLRSAISAGGLPKTPFLSGGWHPVVPVTDLETPALGSSGLGTPNFPSANIQTPSIRTPSIPTTDLQAPDGAIGTPDLAAPSQQGDSFRSGAQQTPGFPSSDLLAPVFHASAIQSAGASPPDIRTLLQNTPERPPLPPSYIIPATTPAPSTPASGQSSPAFGHSSPAFGQSTPSFGQSTPAFGPTPAPARHPQNLRALNYQPETLGAAPDLRALLQQTPDRPPLPPSYIIPATTPAPPSFGFAQQSTSFEAPASDEPAFETPDFPSSDIDTADLQSAAIPNNDLLPPATSFQQNQISSNFNNQNNINSNNNLAQPSLSILPPLGKAQQGIRGFDLVERPKNYYLPVAQTRYSHEHYQHHQPLIHSAEQHSHQSARHASSDLQENLQEHLKQLHHTQNFYRSQFNEGPVLSLADQGYEPPSNMGRYAGVTSYDVPSNHRGI